MNKGFVAILFSLAACTRHGPVKSPDSSSVPLPDASKPNAERVWKATRQQHPLHFQGVFAGPAEGRYRSIVVTEPPPHATIDGIAHALKAIGVETREWTIGYDGWARDIVAVIDHGQATSGIEGSDTIDEDRLAALHQYLFHSTYRAQVHDAFQQPARKQRDLDLTLPPGALHEWLFTPSRSFQGLDGAVLKGADLQAGRGKGVFRADDLGLSILILPRGADLCAFQQPLRDFTLESDLFLGAVSVGDTTILAGRERRTAFDQLPPLRMETLLQLTRADPQQLAQSYQRNNLFAGKLKNGSDWAPILLSGELIDTEFGGLLNITDQLLKGWSLNGTVNYHNFPYAKPSRWAADRPLDDELGVQGLTFNWNTSGAIFEVDWNQKRSIFAGRTGALPIAYIPEGATMPGIGDVEERNRDFFAGENDPHLVRVVAYTAFYHAAKRMAISAGASCQAQAASSGVSATRSPAELFLEQEGRALLEGKSGTCVSKPTTPAQTSQIAEFAKVLASVREPLGEEGLDEFIHYVAGVTSYPTVTHPHQEVLDFAGKLAGQMQRTSLAELIDHDCAFDEYRKRATRPKQGFIGTPTVVVSHIPDTVTREQVDAQHIVERTVVHTGGHNLRNAPGRFTIEPHRQQSEVESRRPFDFSARLGQAYLNADPQVISRIQKDVQDRRIDVEMARKQMDAAVAKTIPLPALSRAETLPGVAGVGYDVPRLKSGNDATPSPFFLVEWKGQADVMYEGLLADGQPITAGSTSAMHDKLQQSIRKWVERNPKAALVLQVRGFDGDRGQRFVRNLGDHLQSATNKPGVIFVIEKPSLGQRVREWLSRSYEAMAAEVTELPDVKLADGRTELTYRVELQGGFGRMLVRLRGVFNAALRTQLTARLHQVWSRRGNIVTAYDDFCISTQHSVEATIEDIGPPKPPNQVLFPSSPSQSPTGDLASRTIVLRDF